MKYNKTNNDNPETNVLHGLFYQWMDNYKNVLAEVKSSDKFKHPFRDIISHDIPNALTEIIPVSSPYVVTGSYGKGRWTDVPWVAVFDTRITKSAQRGVYIVYLLNKETKQLYLTLNQGATAVSQNEEGDKEKSLAFTGIAKSQSGKMTEKLISNAKKIRGSLKCQNQLYDEKINTGSLGYDAGCVCYKKYDIDNLPDDDQLTADLREYMSLYADYYDKFVLGKKSNNVSNKQAWLLSCNPNNWQWEEFSSAVSATRAGKKYERQWSYVNSNVQVGDRVFITLIGTENNGIFASGYASSESFEKEHWDPGKASKQNMDRFIKVDFDWIIDYQKEAILEQSTLIKEFPLQHWSPQESGIAIKDEYIDELEEAWLSICLEGEEELSVKDVVTNIKSYITSKGFCYQDGLVDNFYLSLKTKPFVILAGTSGTGKTRLVKLFAEAVGATTTNGRYKMVPVRPDWSDSSDLFGHVDLNGKFNPGVIIDFVKQAENDSMLPYFLCLDEMNLARVEYYLSDMLSIVETRDFHGDRIISDPLVSDTYYGSDQSAARRYGTIHLPDNLYIIGTVNMDETTFPFSRKVLDRANTIEFSYVNLMPQITDSIAPAASLNLSNSFFKTKYLMLIQCTDELEDVVEYSSELQIINTILEKASAHVGYRVRDEIVFYLLNNKNADLISSNDAMDNEIMQKILPRIQGSSATIKEMLCNLFKHCAGDYDGYRTEDDDISSKMIRATLRPDCKYKKSAAKIAFMVRRYEEDGFTSYWL